MPNRLADSLSPYLLQHQNNPVDWYPWDDKAFELAKKTDRPIFLSVGYAACHWCHVMEHESFENPSIAEFLTKYFVSIKVDREERPDVDQIYMNAVQVMTGRGGWPMSVFLDHDRRPFYAGTYWPPTNRGGLPGFASVLDAIASAWQDRRDEVLDHAGQITTALEQLADGTSSTSTDSAVDATSAQQIIDQTCERLISVLDRVEGGFGEAPKFPHATDLLLLTSQVAAKSNQAAQDAIDLTLHKMVAGGMMDHVGGGFSRYSVDAQWLVPHFEKMLYDNALLAMSYTRAFQVTDDAWYSETATRTLDYLLQEMQDESGGFHCSEDADSEGVEGKYYIWRPNEVIATLGDDRGQRFCEHYNITVSGNFESASIPNLRHQMIDGRLPQWTVETATQIQADRDELRLARNARIHPGRDDKIITAWNSLAINAFAVAGAVLDEASYVDAAVAAGLFIDTQMRRDDGRLLHAYRHGTAHLDAFVDDYAFTVEAFVAIYQVTGDATWVNKAEAVADMMLEHFWDSSQGGFFYTADDSETLITRNKDWHDGSLVSGNGSAANALLSLADLTGRSEYRDRVAELLAVGSSVLQTQSAAAASLVMALDRFHRSNTQIVLAVPNIDDVEKLRPSLLGNFRPHTTLAWNVAGTSNVPLAEGKVCVDGTPTLYVCRDFMCRAPLVGDEAWTELG